MQKVLALPQGDISYGAMMAGHPKFHYHRLPLRKPPQVVWRLATEINGRAQRSGPQ
jgi:hypothetical protein